MSDNLVTGIVSVMLAIVGVGALAVAVSPRAQTGNVVNAGGNAFATALGAAEAPVTGQMPSLTAPSLQTSSFL